MQILESVVMGKNIEKIEFCNDIVRGHYIELHFIDGVTEKYYSVLKTSDNKIQSDIEYEKVEWELEEDEIVYGSEEEKMNRIKKYHSILNTSIESDIKEEEIVYGPPVVDDVTKIGLTMPPDKNGR